MKLVIQIPCYNEESTLAITLSQLPKSINGFDEIKVLIIDDGSTDKESNKQTHGGGNERSTRGYQANNYGE